jgi:vesicle-fusing ATPase
MVNRNGTVYCISYLLILILQVVHLQSFVLKRAPSPLQHPNHLSNPLSRNIWCSSSSSSSSLLSTTVDTPAVAPEQEEIAKDNDDLSAFETIAGNIALCLVQSDLKRDDGRDGASTGWTAWIDEASAFGLQKCLDAVGLISTQSAKAKPNTNHDNFSLLQQQDETRRWIQWIKTSPSPMIFELSHELRRQVNTTLHSTVLDRIDSDHESFLRRIGCRLIALPSGETLSTNLQTPPGAMVYGKLLMGGVTRYRLIGSDISNAAPRAKRRAGERQLIAAGDDAIVPSWLQYGGPERNYQAVDMGFCLLMEFTLLPKGLEQPLLKDIDDTIPQEMMIGNIPWNPDHILDFGETNGSSDSDNDSGSSSSSDPQEVDSPTDAQQLDVQRDDSKLESTFATAVGGLQPQIEEIVRRVLDGRVIRPVASEGASNNTSISLDRIRRQEMEVLLELGLQPVRGLLLYGPPGCGKTALAREISLILDARPPKIVAAPELLDRWVGGSEKLVRDLFADAEGELRLCNGDPTQSALHVLVIDEIDAVFQKRSSAGQDSSGEVTRASAVNQILAKLDGINALGNVLLIGMTNRKEVLDPALMRPGRLEVHVEIPPPNQEGRREILRIHFAALRERGRLSRPLCEAIDGYATGSTTYTEGRRMSFLPWITKVTDGSTRIRDLAADRWTGGFSGADIAGLVRCSGSIALSRSRNQGGGTIDSLLITIEDVNQALNEVKQ